MAEKNTEQVLLIVLGVIGAFAILWLLGMWLMHTTMMGGGMMGSMTGCGVFCFLPLVVLAVAVVGLAIVLLSRNRG